MRKQVVHTRVSEEMYDKLSKNAKKRRVTISNLIRNIVEDSLTLSGEVFDAVDEKIRRRLHKEDKIIGYNAILLSKDTICDIAGEELAKGTQANIAYLGDTSKNLIVCDTCKNKIEKEEQTKDN